MAKTAVEVTDDKKKTTTTKTNTNTSGGINTNTSNLAGVTYRSTPTTTPAPKTTGVNTNTSNLAGATYRSTPTTTKTAKYDFTSPTTSKTTTVKSTTAKTTSNTSSTSNKTSNNTSNNTSGSSYTSSKPTYQTRNDFSSDRDYENYIVGNKVDTTKGDAFDYISSKAKEKDILPRQYFEEMRIRFSNMSETEKVREKVANGKVDNQTVEDINNRYSVIIDQDGNEIDPAEYVNNVDLVNKTAEDLNKEIEKLNKDYTSGKIDYDTLQAQYNALQAKWNENAAMGERLNGYRQLNGFDYYDWAKQNQKDVSDFEAYVENVNDWMPERLAEAYAASWVDTMNILPQTLDVLGQIVSPENYNPDNGSAKLTQLSNEIKEYAFAGTNPVEKWSLECLSSLMPMINAMMIGSLLPVNPEVFTNVALGLQGGVETTKQRLAEGTDPGVALMNGVLHGTITGLVEARNAGMITEVFTGAPLSYLAKLGLAEYAGPRAILGYMAAMGLSEGAEETIETVADWLADTTQNIVTSIINYTTGSNISQVNVTEVDPINMANEFAMAAVGAAVLGAPNAVSIEVNTKQKYNAFMEARKHFESVLDSELSLPEEKALAQKSIEVIDYSVKPFSQESVLSQAVDLPTDAVAPAVTYDEMVNNLSNAIQPDVSEKLVTAQQTLDTANKVKADLQESLWERNINMSAEDYINLAPEARSQFLTLGNFFNSNGVNSGFGKLGNGENGKLVSDGILLNTDQTRTIDIDALADLDRDTYRTAIKGNTNDIFKEAGADASAVTAAVHEVTHFAEKSGLWENLKNTVREMMGRKRFDTAVSRLNSIYKTRGVMDADAEHEAVAFFIQKNLGNQAFLEKLSAYNGNAFNRLLNNVKSLFNGNTKTELENRFMKAFVDSKKAFDVDVRNGSVAPVMSLGTWNETDVESLANAIVEELNANKTLGSEEVTRDEVMKWIESVNGVAKMIADDIDRLGYVSNSTYSAMKSNSDYKYTIDMSTLCKKRLLLQGTIDQVQRAMPNTPLTSMDYIVIRELLNKKGLEVSCGFCYVESARRHLGDIAQQFIEKTGADVTIADLLTVDGVEELQRTRPEIYDEFVKFNNARGQARDMLVQTRTEYRGEIRKLTERAVADLIKNGGLRLQSYSDFETPHLIDMMQVVLDMASKGLTSQAYTKVPNFADAFGNTNVKINLSLVCTGLDENGELIFDDKEGMPHEDAFRLREKYSKNVGTVLVGKDDPTILAAMADPRIDYIIPFHKSGWANEEFERLGIKGYDNYTDYQHETLIKPRRYKLTSGPNKGKMSKPIRKPKGGDLLPLSYWDFNASGRDNAVKYLELCKEEGRVPKFYQFLVDNGDGSWSLQPDGSTDGYWKTLIDFKMYDNDGIGSPQERVVPIFDDAVNQRIFDEYQGDHTKLPVNEDVVKEFLEGKRSGQYSLGEDPNGEYEQFSLGEVTNEETKDFLENQDKVKVYRAMAMIDGKLYPPMATKTADAETGQAVLQSPSEIGKWYQAEERPDLAREDGMFPLKKDNGKVVWAAYNPYFHTSLSVLNDQFTSAYDRPNLVVVEGEVPSSELTSGYRAEKAKDAVGKTEWHSGTVSSQLKKKGKNAREVILSRWFKPVRVLSDAEVAQGINDMLSGTDVEVPFNVVTPGVRAELENLGVPIGDSVGLKAKLNKDGQYSLGEEVEKIKAKGRNSHSKRDALILRDAGEKLSESDFYKVYSAHILNLRNLDNLQEQIDNIRSEGFKGDAGFGVNVMPSFITRYIDEWTEDSYNQDRYDAFEKIGYEYQDEKTPWENLKENPPAGGVFIDGSFYPSLNAGQLKYGVRKGQTVLLVPDSWVEDDSRVKNGFIPFDYEIVTADRNFQPYYELYEKAYDRSSLSDVQYALGENNASDGLDSVTSDLEISDEELPIRSVAPTVGKLNSVATVLSEAPAPKTPADVKRRLKSLAKWFIIDTNNGITDFADEVKNERIKDLADYAMTSRSRALTAIYDGIYDSEGKEKIGKSLVEIKGALPKELSNLFDEYMYHYRNIDDMSMRERMGDEFKDRPVFGESVTADDSLQRVMEIEEQHPEFKQIAEDIWEYTRTLLGKQIGGIVSQEDYDNFQKMRPHYVPISRNVENGKGKGKTDPNRVILKFKGSSIDINPLDHALMQYTQRAYDSLDRNNLYREIVEAMGGGKEVKADTMQDLTDENFARKTDSGHELIAYINGKQVAVPINEDMYRSISNKGVPDYVTKALEPMAKINQVRKSLITSLNPFFGIRNVAKDIQDAGFNTHYPKSFLKNYPEAVAQIGSEGEIYKQFKRLGGTMSNYTADDLTKAFEKMKSNTGMTKRINRLFGLNDDFETAPRLAEFISSLEAGNTVEKALYDAAEVTTNFKRGGAGTKFADKYLGFTFLNASVQGYDKHVRESKNNFRKARANGIRGVISLMAKLVLASGLPLRLLQEFFWRDDDDYQELSDYIKNNYYIYWKTKDGKFLRINKGRIAAFYQTVLMNGYKTVTRQANMWDAMLDDATSFLDNIAPNNPLDNNIYSPLWQATNNKTWYGDPIVSETLQNNHEKWEQYDEETDLLSRKIGELSRMVADATGSDIFQLSPKKISYVLDQYSGIAGDLTLPALTPKTDVETDNPLFKGLVSSFLNDFTTDPVLKNQKVTDFFELRDELNKKSGRSEENKLSAKYMNGVYSEMAKLYGQIHDIQGSDMPNKAKMDETRRLREQINDLAREALNNYDQIDISGDYATVGGVQYYRNEDGWTKPSKQQLENMDGLSNEDRDTYMKTISDITSIRKDIKDSTPEGQTANYTRETIDAISNSKMSAAGKNALFDTYYSGKAVGHINAMDLTDEQKYNLKVANKTAESKKDANGETIANSKAEATAEAYRELGLLDTVLKYIRDNNINPSEVGLSKTVYNKLIGGGNSSSKKKKATTEKKKKVRVGSAAKTKVSTTGSRKGSVKKIGSAPASKQQTQNIKSKTFLKSYSKAMGRRSATGSSSSTKVCPKCGARVPMSYTRCPVCGSNV